MHARVRCCRHALLRTVSPSPVPPNSRTVDSSACTNGMNMRCSLSGSTPMPVSITWNCSHTADGDAAAMPAGSAGGVCVTSTRSSIEPPSRVNFIELLNKLVTTCVADRT